MRRIQDMGIREKMKLLGWAGIVGVLALGTAAALMTSRTNETRHKVSSYWIPAVTIPMELNHKTSDYRILESYYLMADSDEEREALEPELDGLRADIKEGFLEYRQYATEGSQKVLDTAEDLWEDYMKLSTTMLAVCRANENDPQLRELFNQSRLLFEDGSDQLLQIVEYKKAGAEQSAARGDSAVSMDVMLEIGILLSIAAGLAWLISHIMKCMLKPLQELLDASRKVRSGDLDASVLYRSQDEMGEMAQSMNELTESLRAIISDQKEVMEQIADGNYRAQSQSPSIYRGDFGPLLYGVQNLASRLQHEKEEREKDGTGKVDDADKTGGLSENS